MLKLISGKASIKFQILYAATVANGDTTIGAISIKIWKKFISSKEFSH